MNATFKMKCTAIRSFLTSRAKKDAAGQPVKNEKGIPVWEPCPIWTFTFDVCGNPQERHGSFNVTTTDRDEAAKFELGKTYPLTLGQPEQS